MKKQFLYTGLAVMLGFSAVAQKNPAAVKFSETINKQRGYDHLSILASDEYEGRETGKKGAWMAAEYIKKQFQSFGLKGPVKDGADPYFQKIGYASVSLSKSELSVNGQVKQSLKDFYITPATVSAKGFDVKGTSILFAGYGLNKDDFNDYAGQDVAGKIVMIFSSGDPTAKPAPAPAPGARRTAPSSSGSLQVKIKYLLEHNAAGVLVINPTADNLSPQLKNVLTNSNPYLKTAERMKNIAAGTALPTVMIGTEVANQIFAVANTNLDEIKKKINESLKPATMAINIPVAFSAASVENDVRAENVLGFLEGSDPKLKNEVLVVTGHYDHIGLVTNPNATDKVNNGADDDGSGTTGVLMLAEAFSKAKKAGKGPKRSILFMTVCGEEKGLLGSEWYAEHPVFPIANTITNLNIDMIGRGDKDHPDNNFVYIIGSNMLSDDLDRVGKKANADYTNILLDEKYNNRTDPNQFYYRSDHYNFAKFGIPVIFYFNGVHEDYHQPGDEVSKIDFPMLAKRAQLVYFTAWELANGANRPVVNKNDDGTLKTK